MIRKYHQDLLMASATTGESVKELKDKMANRIRGQRQAMMIFDCAYGCPHAEHCKKGKVCPYE